MVQYKSYVENDSYSFYGGRDMKKQTEVYKLSNGVGIPCIGFGTWQTPERMLLLKA